MLSAKRVAEIFEDCLLLNEEDDHILIDGVIGTVAMSVAAIERHKAEIMELLMELPETFRASVGGGWSFLNACMDKNREQWGEHHNINQLVILGLAAGKVEFCLPRKMWDVFPGGMPYFVIKDVEEKDGSQN